jgi:CrcB protein
MDNGHGGRGRTMTLLLILAVVAGGGAGAACRYGVGRVVRSRDRGAFPLGVVLINVAGCVVLGFLLGARGLLHRGAPLLATVPATAFLGGYTTGGVYALEGVLLHRGGNRRGAEGSLVGSVTLGVLAAIAGVGLGSLV